MRSSASLGLWHDGEVESSSGVVMFRHVCARCSGQPDTATCQCHDQAHVHMPGSFCFPTLSTPYLLSAVHARALRMAVARHAHVHARALHTVGVSASPREGYCC